jgi:hypothetical protein
LLEKSMEKQEMRIRSSSDDHNLSKLEEWDIELDLRSFWLLIYERWWFSGWRLDI